MEGELSFGLRDAVQVPTLIRLAFGQPPSPLKGEGFRAAARAAPTAYPEARLSFRRGRSQTGPRAHTVRPDREEKKRAVNDLWERESPRRFAPPF